MRFRGAKKSKTGTDPWWVRSGIRGRWHRVDPSNGSRTACGFSIQAGWSLPYQTDDPTKGTSELLCKLVECRGIETSN